MMVDLNGSGVFFIGNATMLIRYHGFTLLTDPNFLHRGQRAYLGYGLSSGAGPIRRSRSTGSRPSTWWCCRTCTATTGTGWRAAAWTRRCRS
ncbi:hypothetical protein ACFQX6_31590 [Streptosporangium lutulentum]